MQTDQQNYGAAGDYPGEDPGGMSVGSATEFTYTDPGQSFVGTVREMVTRPAGFFRGIARRGDYANPLIFALICTVISTAIGGFLGILYATLGIGGTGVGEAAGAFVASMFFTPIILAIGLFVGAGILHLLVALIIKPAETGFESTFRVVSYTNVTELVAWVPVIGPLVAAVGSVMLAIIGVREVHETTTGKAALVVLIPAAVALLVVLFLIVVVGVAIFFAAQ